MAEVVRPNICLVMNLYSKWMNALLFGPYNMEHAKASSCYNQLKLQAMHIWMIWLSLVTLRANVSHRYPTLEHFSAFTGCL
jgi:hypothetical protein